MDSLFSVRAIAKTPNPQALVYAAMHQDYSADWVGDLAFPKGESAYGRIIVDNLVKGNRGHFGPFEHPSITFSVGYFPHSVMQQIRTHRVGISFDVQSFRYTSESLIATDIERAIYLRPVGIYKDRKGHGFNYTQKARQTDLERAKQSLKWYADNLGLGMPEEQARSLVPFDVRQHWVMTVNARSLMHLLDLRAKADAQPECQHLCQFLMFEFRGWMPEVAEWYEKHRFAKALLAP